MTAADLTAYVGAPPSDDAFVGACWVTAVELVTRYVGGATVPGEITDRATLEVGSELFHRRQAPNGIAQFASPDGGAAVRVARDPMVAAYPLLAPYVGLGVG